MQIVKKFNQVEIQVKRQVRLQAYWRVRAQVRIQIYKHDTYQVWEQVWVQV